MNIRIRGKTDWRWRWLAPFLILLAGCGVSGSIGKSNDRTDDPLGRYVGHECVVRVRPNVLGAVRDNPVEVDGGMQNGVGVAAQGRLERVDGAWLAVTRRDGGTTLVAQDTVVTIDLGPNPDAPRP